MLHSLQATTTRVVLLAIPLLSAWPFPAHAQTAYQVKDINTAETIGGLNPHDPVSVGNRVFFVGEAQMSGSEIWVTDGTSAGTRLVADLRPGNENQWGPEHLTDVNGTLFFTFDDKEVWKSDGTAAGTVKLTEVDYRPEELTDVNGVLFFVSQNSLWRSDGTPAGTRVLKDFRYPRNLANANGTLFLDAIDPAIGNQGLFKSDGTAQGTRLVASIPIHPDVRFAAQGDRVFFAHVNGQPWVSDGTPQGTHVVVPGDPGVVLSEVSEFEVVGGTVYFAAKEGTGTPRTLWRTDGTSVNTVRVSTVEPRNLTNRAGLLYFIGNDIAAGQELWVSDGTTQGTHLVKDTCPGSCGVMVPQFSLSLPTANGIVYFRGAKNDAGQVPLWRSDGTGQGTFVLLPDVQGIPSFADPGFAGNDPWMYLTGRVPSYGELLRTDGTVAGTTVVYQQRVAGSSAPGGLTRVGDTLYFSAWEQDSGSEIWSSDGTPGGTQLSADISPGPDSSFSTAPPPGRAALGGALLFSANPMAGGALANRGLWRTDGTEGGTFQLGTAHPIAPGPEVVGDVAYFASGGLFRTDGTPEGTIQAHQFATGVRLLINVDGVLYFSTFDGVFRLDSSAQGWRLLASEYALSLLSFRGKLYFGTRSALWESDGTPEGTRVVVTLNGLSVPVKSGGRFFFVSSTGSGGDGALWQSDGTSAGTFMIKDILGRDLTDSQGLLFFVEQDSPYYPGHGLWKTNGTAAGTVLVKDLPSVSDLVDVNGTLYFAAHDPERGRELWRSDGTPEGTVLVQDISPGPASSYPQGFALVGDLVYFSANDGTTGAELWAFPVPASAVAAMTSPAPASRLPGATATFTWAPGANASEYWLTIGTTFGGGQILSASQGRNLSRVVGGLPVDGRTVYVRLWTLFGGNWRSVDYTYLAAVPRPATMVTPIPGAALNSSVVTFNWEAGAGATAYWLYVGTTPGGKQIYPGSQVTNLSATVSGIPTTGATVYVRLFSLIGVVWQHIDYTYTTGAPAVVLTVNSTAVQPGQTVQVTLQGGPGNLRDWIGLHNSAALDTTYLDWKYLNGTKTIPATSLTSATLAFTMPTTAGTYNFRFFQNGGFTKLATSPTVTVGTVVSPVLSVTPTSLPFADVAVGTTLDKSVVVKNTGGGTLSGAGSVTGTGYSVIGTASYSLTANQEMTLTVRFAPTATGSANGTLTLTGAAGAAVPLTGNGTSSGPSLTIAGGVTTVVPGATVLLQVANGPGSPKDWVGLHSAAAADTVYLDWKYLNGTRTAPVTGVTSATLSFAMPTAPGAYQFRFFANNTFARLATSATVTVTPATTPTLTVSATTVSPGQSVQVTVQNGPGNLKDWIALAATGAANTSYSSWFYLNGTRTAPSVGLTAATVTFTMPTTPGTYEFRFFQNNTYTRLVTSPTVTVQ